jgi:proline iminopeptidase
MHIAVNGVRLYVDIEGAGLVADGPRMREKPALVLVHGGPGADHSIYKPAFSALSDIAQIVYYDHRGCGRSGDATPDTWTLAQWADDLKTLCETLGLVRPIVYGASFGGFVAATYATRHPGHAGKLILTSTAARVDFEAMFLAFRDLGGPAAGDAARAYWSNPDPTTRAAYMQLCLPLYHARPATKTDWATRAITRNATGQHFNGPRNEMGRMDLRPALARVTCPTLILAGDRDPVMPVSFSREIAASLPPHLVRFECLENCGHGVIPDDPERAFALLRDFIAAP